LPYLGDGVLNDLLVGHIALVTDEKLVDTLGGVTVNLLQPLLDVVERVHIGHIVDDADAVGATVVGGCDGSETFLAGGVPLQLYHMSARGKSLGIIERNDLIGLTIWSFTVLPSSSMVRIF